MKIAVLGAGAIRCADHVARGPVRAAAQYQWSRLQGPALNVAQAYARFARDYREGTHLCSTFDSAVTRHRMLDAIETAAATGKRQTPG